MKRIILIFGAIFFVKILSAQYTIADFITNNVCFGDSVVLISTSVSSDSIIAYEWDLDADGNFNDAFGDTVKAFFPVGLYSIGHRIVTNTGNANAIYKQVSVNEMPVPDFSFTVPCFGDSTEFTNLSVIGNDTIINLLWKFGDGFETDLLEHPKHQYPAPGIYNVTLRPLTNKGCADSITKTLVIYPKPVITIQITGDTIFFKGGSATLSVVESYPTYNWSTGSTNNSIIVSNSGTYLVEVADTNGCTNSTSVNITVIDMDELLPMTLFTPNNDGYNDFWHIQNIELCNNPDIKVYNRWGDEVFSSKGYNNDWDGKYDGKELPSGTYYFIIDCNKRIYKGAVNILR